MRKRGRMSLPLIWNVWQKLSDVTCLKPVLWVDGLGYMQRSGAQVNIHLCFNTLTALQDCHDPLFVFNNLEENTSQRDCRLCSHSERGLVEEMLKSPGLGCMG